MSFLVLLKAKNEDKLKTNSFDQVRNQFAQFGGLTKILNVFFRTFFVAIVF